jgi:hypothetical protein
MRRYFRIAYAISAYPAGSLSSIDQSVASVVGKDRERQGKAIGVSFQK